MATGARGNTWANNLAITACARGSQWRLALRVFRGLRASRTAPSVVTYGAVLDALARAGQRRAASRMLAPMRRGGRGDLGRRPDVPPTTVLSRRASIGEAPLLL